MNKLLTKFIHKSFSKLAPNSTVTNTRVSEVIQIAATTQDFLENTSKKAGNKPNADIIFKRIKDCNIKKLKLTFSFILEFLIKQVKHKLNRREWTVAIDAHYEPFYGNYMDLWVHAYKPKKGCNGSYKFITISIVMGDARFTLLALPVRRGDYTEDLVEELLLTARKYIRIRLVLLDRGFYSAAIIKKLDALKIGYIMFIPRNKKNKKFLKDTDAFSHRYVNHEIIWNHDKTKEKVKFKILIIKDFVDITNFKIYDWIFATNLTNTKALHHVMLYKQRWGIETTYRMFGKFRITTTSVNPVVRYFLFLFVVLLYNLWKFYNMISKFKITFKTFVYFLFLSSISLEHIETFRWGVGNILDLEQIPEINLC